MPEQTRLEFGILQKYLCVEGTKNTVRAWGSWEKLLEKSADAEGQVLPSRHLAKGERSSSGWICAIPEAKERELQVPQRRDKCIGWYKVYETRCQLKISLGTARKETWIIYPLATCSVEHKGPKPAGFPYHMPQDTVDSVTGHCLTFQCVNRDGNLWANTRTPDTAALLERFYCLHLQRGSFLRWICEK